MPEPRKIKLYMANAALFSKQIEAGIAINECLEAIGEAVRMPPLPFVDYEPAPLPPILSSVSFTIQHPSAEFMARISPKCAQCCHFQRYPAMCRRSKRRINPNNPSCPKFGPLSSTPNRKRK